MTRLVPVLKATGNSEGTLRREFPSDERKFEFVHVQMNACLCTQQCYHFTGFNLWTFSFIGLTAGVMSEDKRENSCNSNSKSISVTISCWCQIWPNSRSTAPLSPLISFVNTDSGSNWRGAQSRRTPHTLWTERIGISDCAWFAA